MKRPAPTLADLYDMLRASDAPPKTTLAAFCKQLRLRRAEMEQLHRDLSQDADKQSHRDLSQDAKKQLQGFILDRLAQGEPFEKRLAAKLLATRWTRQDAAEALRDFFGATD